MSRRSWDAEYTLGSPLAKPKGSGTKIPIGESADTGRFIILSLIGTPGLSCQLQLKPSGRVLPLPWRHSLVRRQSTRYNEWF